MKLFPFYGNKDVAQLRLAVSGDVRATEQLVRQLTPRAMSLASRMLGVTEDAQDVVQDAFMQLWRSSGSFKGDASLATYFYTIVSRKCLDHIRRKKEVSVVDDDFFEQVQSTDKLPDEIFLAKQENKKISQLLDGLAPRQRMAIVLWAYHDETVENIANMLEIPSNAAHQLLHRAKQNLKQLMREEYESTKS